jgi:hypothetical protein
MLLRSLLQQLAAAWDSTPRFITRTPVHPCARQWMRPNLEALEDRTVPTNITYNGGPLIPNVQVSNIVAGAQPLDTTGLMQALVRDYLPLLGPYYGIGAGSVRSTVSTNPFSGNPSDAMIQSFVLQEINAGAVAPPGGNQLYFTFLPPGQRVSDFGSESGVSGYHSAFFVYHDATGYHQLNNGQVFTTPVQPIPVYFAVSFGGSADDVSQTASHELAEAVTDPEGYSGYIDPSLGASGEVADIYDFQNPFVLDGYKVAVLSGPQGQKIDSPLVQVPQTAQAPQVPQPPTLHKPWLLSFFDQFLHGVETVNPDGSATVTDNLFGFSLTSKYDSSGDLQSVTLFGMNVTLLFEFGL